MKKLMAFIMPLKAFAAMIFTGFMCLYVISGFLYAAISGEAFSYTIPFIFVLQGLVSSILISILWGICFSNTVIKRWRFFPRLIVFKLSLLALLTVCFLTFHAIPTDWAKLWLIVAGGIALGVIILSGLSEIYLKKTGKRYTEALNIYKMNI